MWNAQLLSSTMLGMLALAALTAGPAMAQGGPVQLTEAVRDLDGDEQPDTLEVLMLEGERYTDAESWCGQGDKYEGDFAVRVRFAKGPSIQRRLDLGPFFWAGSWDVVFDDYNHDGTPDFNLGQYRSCAGFSYRLYTVTSSGRVRPLLQPGQEVAVLDFRNSSDRIRTVEDGIEVCRYDRSHGHVRVRYRWDEEHGVFVVVGEEDVDSCPGTVGESDAGQGRRENVRDRSPRYPVGVPSWNRTMHGQTQKVIFDP